MSISQLILVIVLGLIVIVNVFYLFFKAWDKLSENESGFTMIGIIITLMMVMSFGIAVNTINKQLKGHHCPEYEEVDIKLYKIK